MFEFEFLSLVGFCFFMTDLKQSWDRSDGENCDLVCLGASWVLSAKGELGCAEKRAAAGVGKICGAPPFSACKLCYSLLLSQVSTRRSSKNGSCAEFFGLLESRGVLSADEIRACVQKCVAVEMFSFSNTVNCFVQISLFRGVGFLSCFERLFKMKFGIICFGWDIFAMNWVQYLKNFLQWGN